MEFLLPHYSRFKKNLIEIARRFRLNPEKLKIEFFTPDCQAILIEEVDNQDYQIHINLEENRIISIKRLTNHDGGYPDHIKEKYREFMK